MGAPIFDRIVTRGLGRIYFCLMKNNISEVTQWWLQKMQVGVVVVWRFCGTVCRFSFVPFANLTADDL